MNRFLELLGNSPGLIGFRRLSKPDALEKSVQRIFDRWPDVVPLPKEEDREAILANLKDRIERGDWKGTRLSEVTTAARAAFHESRLRRPDLSGVRHFLYEQCAASRRKSFMSCMASVYLDSYRPGAQHTRRLAVALGNGVDRLPGRSRRMFENLPELLDHDRGPEVLARRMADADNPYLMLHAAGMITPHGPGFMAFAHRAFVDRLRPRLAKADRETALQLFAWLAPDPQKVREGEAELAIEALLAPWRDTDPDERYRKLLIDRLTAAYGDPRIRPTAIWNAVQSKAVLHRWLVGATLDAFLDIVSESEDSHMWAPRRRFWQQLNKEKLISAAWVALSPRGAKIARRQAAAADEVALREFGIQTAGGSRSNTSLLVMQINGKTVVEGSHSYKIHIFPKGCEEAPRLYLRHYDCERIRWQVPPGEARPHLGDWQGWVRERL